MSRGTLDGSMLYSERVANASSRSGEGAVVERGYGILVSLLASVLRSCAELSLSHSYCWPSLVACCSSLAVEEIQRKVAKAQVVA